MPSYSTQATVEARISTTRLSTYTEFDGGPVQATVIEAGIAFAGGYISSRLLNRYGQTEIDTWVLPDDVPPLIGWISDSLCIYNYAVSKPHLFADVNIQEIFDTADGMLDKLDDGTMALDNVTAPVTDQYQVDRIKSDFDPERDVDNLTVNPNWVKPSDPRELPDYPE